MSSPAPPVVPVSPAFRRRPPRWRVACWLVVLVAGAHCASSESGSRAPQDELAALAEVVRRDGGRTLFHCSDSAAIGFHPRRGWVLTVYVGHEADFRPADHLVLTRVDGALHADLIEPTAARSGVLQQVRLVGPPLDEYLARTRLDVTPVDRVFADLFGPAPVTSR